MPLALWKFKVLFPRDDLPGVCRGHHRRSMLGPVLTPPHPDSAPFPPAPSYFLELCDSTTWSLWNISGGRNGRSFPPSSEYTRRCRLVGEGTGAATGAAGFRQAFPARHTSQHRAHIPQRTQTRADAPGKPAADAHQAWQPSTGPSPGTAPPASAFSGSPGAQPPQLLGNERQRDWFLSPQSLTRFLLR